MDNKIFFPNTVGILRTMLLVYIMVMLFGSILTFMKAEGLETWLSFAKVSLVYLGICAILYLSIKSQRIILDEKYFVLKVIGITRHQIPLSKINEIRKGKMSGSPIMEIVLQGKGRKPVLPVPFLPFEENWDEILQSIQNQCDKNVIGEMVLRREKGELRTWD
jgi:hypothetical protein